MTKASLTFGLTAMLVLVHAGTASAAPAGPLQIAPPDTSVAHVRMSRQEVMMGRCRMPSNGNAKFPSRRRDCRAPLSEQSDGSQAGGPARKIRTR